MNNFVKVLVFCVVGLFVQVSTSHSAVLTCTKMQITYITDNSIWAKNVSGASCGSIPNGAENYFVFKPEILDRLLAISLSAMSLQKYVWLHALGDTTGSIVAVIAIAE